MVEALVNLNLKRLGTPVVTDDVLVLTLPTIRLSRRFPLPRSNWLKLLQIWRNEFKSIYWDLFIGKKHSGWIIKHLTVWFQRYCHFQSILINCHYTSLFANCKAKVNTSNFNLLHQFKCFFLNNCLLSGHKSCNPAISYFFPIS